jgi:hypothetical protein
MQLQLLGQYKVMIEPLHSQQLVWQEELQPGQLTAEVIKLCKEAETARQEALTWGKELRIDLLIGRLNSGLLEGQTLQSLVETFQEGLSWPSDKCHHQYNNSNRAKHCQLPLMERHANPANKANQIEDKGSATYSFYYT